MMIRACLQVLACWYQDSDRDVPAWLKRRIDADPALRESLERMHRLERDLRCAARSELERSREEHHAVPPAARMRNAGPSQPMLGIGLLSLGSNRRAFPYALAASLAILAGAGVWLMTAAQRSTPNVVATASPPPNWPNAVSQTPEQDPATLPSHSPSNRKTSPLIAAKRWLDRSLQQDSVGPPRALPHESSKATSHAEVAATRLEAAWREPLASVKAGVRDGTRYFAVRLPVAGLKMLHPSDR